MGLRSPFGQRPSSVPNPAQPNLSLAGLQQLQAIPQKENIPPMPQRAPASAPPAQDNEYANPASYNEYADAKSYAQPEQKGFLDSNLGQAMVNSPFGIVGKVKALIGAGKEVVEHPIRTAGGIAGGAAGAALGGPAGAIAGAGVGTGLAEKAEAFVQGRPSEAVKQGLMAAGGAALGVGAGVAGSMLEGGAMSAEAAAARNVLASNAGEAAQPKIDAAKGLGAPIMSYQSGEGTPLGEDAKVVAQAIAAGKYGDLPRAELMSNEKAQDVVFNGYIQKMIDKFPTKFQPLSNPKMNPTDMATGQTGFKLSPNVGKEELKPSTFAQDWLDNFHSMLSTTKGRIKEVVGDRQFDTTIPEAAEKMAMGKILDENGNPIPGLKLPEEEKRLMNMIVNMRRVTSRQNMFTETGGSPPSSYPRQGPLSESPVVPPLSVAMLPPNEAGSQSRVGMNFDMLDKFVSQIQNVAHSDTSSPMKDEWRALSKHATSSFYDTIRGHVEPIDPESSNMLQRLNSLYSKYSDDVVDMANSVKKNPSAATRVFIDKDNPDKTKIAFHVLNQDQADTVRRSFIVDSAKKAIENDGTLQAKSMLDHLNSYGDENINNVFGPEKDAILGSLKTIAQLQRTQIGASAKNALTNKLEINMSQSKIMRQAQDLLSGFFMKDKPLQNYIGSPDFTDKVIRRSKLLSAKDTAYMGAATGAPPVQAAESAPFKGRGPTEGLNAP